MPIPKGLAQQILLDYLLCLGSALGTRGSCDRKTPTLGILHTSEIEPRQGWARLSSGLCEELCRDPMVPY